MARTQYGKQACSGYGCGRRHARRADEGQEGPARLPTQQERAASGEHSVRGGHLQALELCWLEVAALASRGREHELPNLTGGVPAGRESVRRLRRGLGRGWAGGVTLQKTPCTAALQPLRVRRSQRAHQVLEAVGAEEGGEELGAIHVVDIQALGAVRVVPPPEWGARASRRGRGGE